MSSKQSSGTELRIQKLPTDLAEVLFPAHTLSSRDRAELATILDSRYNLVPAGEGTFNTFKVGEDIIMTVAKSILAKQPIRLNLSPNEIRCVEARLALMRAFIEHMPDEFDAIAYRVILKPLADVMAETRAELRRGADAQQQARDIIAIGQGKYTAAKAADAEARQQLIRRTAEAKRKVQEDLDRAEALKEAMRQAREAEAKQKAAIVEAQKQAAAAEVNQKISALRRAEAASYTRTHQQTAYPELRSPLTPTITHPFTPGATMTRPTANGSNGHRLGGSSRHY